MTLDACCVNNRAGLSTWAGIIRVRNAKDCIASAKTEPYIPLNVKVDGSMYRTWLAETEAGHGIRVVPGPCDDGA